MQKKLLLYLLIFVTSCENYITDSNNSDPELIFDAFWSELNRHYAFFNYSTYNWDSVYNVCKSQLASSASENDLIQVCNQVLNLLNDAHTNLYTPKGVFGNLDYFQKYPLNQIDNIEDYFDDYSTENRIFNVGYIKSENIGYVKINTFEGNQKYFSKIDSILNILIGCRALIIDVRSNRGGLISNSTEVINRFTDKRISTCKYRFRNGSEHYCFTDWIEYFIHPAGDFQFQNTVVLLTNRSSYSATEWFVLSAQSLPNFTIIGDTTGGGSSIPILRELPNGWILRISNSQCLLPSGRDFQSTGIFPDIPIWITDDAIIRNEDTILERALTYITTGI